MTNNKTNKIGQGGVLKLIKDEFRSTRIWIFDSRKLREPRKMLRVVIHTFSDYNLKKLRLISILETGNSNYVFTYKYRLGLSRLWCSLFQ